MGAFFIKQMFSKNKLGIDEVHSFCVNDSQNISGLDSFNIHKIFVNTTQRLEYIFFHLFICKIELLSPETLKLAQLDRFDH